MSNKPYPSAVGVADVFGGGVTAVGGCTLSAFFDVNSMGGLLPPVHCSRWVVNRTTTNINGENTVMTTTTAVTTFNGLTGQSLVSSKGKQVGARMVFMGESTAGEVREALRKQGLKGNKLKEGVNEVLSGKKDIAWAKHDAAVSVLRSNGYQPDYVDARKSGATVRFVKPLEVKKKDEAQLTREAALVALGLTAEQFALMADLVKK